MEIRALGGGLGLRLLTTFAEVAGAQSGGGDGENRPQYSTRLATGPVGRADTAVSEGTSIRRLRNADHTSRGFSLSRGVASRPVQCGVHESEVLVLLGRSFWCIEVGISR